MLPFSIIKDFDIFKAGSPHVGMGCVPYAMDALVLETVKPAFSGGVIPAIALAAHRTRHVEFLELFLKRIAGVLASSIRVMHDARPRSLAKPGHRQRIGDQIGRHAWLERPANHFAVKQIENGLRICSRRICPPMPFIPFWISTFLPSK